MTALFAWWTFNKLTNSVKIAALSTVFYTGYMYRLINLYVRSALGESLAMIFFPAALVSLWLVLSGRTRYWPMIVVSWTGVLQSHVISAVLMVMATVLMLAFFGKQLSERDIRQSLLKTSFFLILLNAWFYVPFLYYYVSVDFSMKHQIQTISLSWFTFTDIVGVEFFCGLFFLALLASYLVYLAYKRFYKRETVSSPHRYFWTFLILGIVAIIGMDYRFPWILIDPFGFLSFMQFPFRLSIFPAFFLSFCLAVAVSDILERIRRERYRMLLAVLVVSSVTFCNFFSLVFGDVESAYLGDTRPKPTQHRFCDILKRVALLRPEQYGDMMKTMNELKWPRWDVDYVHQESLSLFGFNKYSDLSKKMPQKDIKSDVKVESWQKKGTDILLVYSSKKGGRVELPILYYDGYAAVTSRFDFLGVRAATGSNRLVVNIPPGKHNKVYIRYTGLPIFHVAELLTLIGIVLFLHEILEMRRLVPGCGMEVDDEDSPPHGDREILKCFLGGGALGILVFIYAYGGFLDVTKTLWAMGGGDGAQHYMGWKVFRDSPWTFPIGLTDRYCWPQPVSVIYSDALPLFAIPFKILRSYLPDDFQYMGIWAGLVLLMQGGLAALIFRRYIGGVLLPSVLSLFFTVKYTVFYRIFGHEALGGQWLILLAMAAIVWSERIRSHKASRLLMGLAGALSVLVHGYFVPMVGGILLVFLYCRWWKNGEQKEFFTGGLMYVVGVFTSMYVLGAFSSGMDMTVGHKLGSYYSNLCSLFNPSYQSVFSWLRIWDKMPRNEEGAGYLGIGVILILSVSLYIMAKDALRKGRLRFSESYIVPSLIMCSMFLFVAHYPKIYFASNLLFEFPVPDFVNNTLSLFGTNGRFIWIPSYFVTFFAVVYAAKRYSKTRAGLMMIFVFLVLNVAELMPVMAAKHYYTYERRPKIEGTILKGLAPLDTVLAGKKRVVFLYHKWENIVQRDLTVAIAYYASRNDVPQTLFRLARMPSESVEKECARNLALVRAGKGEKDVVYVFPDKKSVREAKKLYIYRLNDTILGSRSRLKGLKLWKKV